jgi:hypothetical protein
MPQHFRDISDSLHNRWLEDIAQSDGLLCISRAVADEVLEWLKVKEIQRSRSLGVGWFHLGADLHASQPSRGMPSDSLATVREDSRQAGIPSRRHHRAAKGTPAGIGRFRETMVGWGRGQSGHRRAGGVGH